MGLTMRGVVLFRVEMDVKTEAQGNPPLKVDIKGFVGFRMALFRRLLIPFNGLRDIFFYAMAKFIDEAELILRFGMTLFGS